jgi:predicted transcriptional regulator
VFKNAVLNIAMRCISASAKLRRRKKSCGLCGHEKVVKMRRSKLEIVADILQVCLVPRGKTRIMCNARLNFTHATDYLRQLTSLGLLSQKNGKYKTTDKGRQFISAYNHLGEIIGIRPSSLAGMKALSPLAPAKRHFSPFSCGRTNF